MLRLEADGYIKITPEGGPAYRGDRKPNLYKLLIDENDWSPGDTSFDERLVNSTLTTGHEDVNDRSAVTTEPSFLKPSLSEPGDHMSEICNQCDEGWVFVDGGTVARCGLH